MRRNLRQFVFVAVLTMLAACQQAVRPNLAAQPSGATAETEAAPASIPPTPGQAPADPAPAEGAEVQAGDAEPAGIHLAGRGDEVFARINQNLSPQSCQSDSSSKRWRLRYNDNPAAFAQHLEDILPLLDFVSVEVERAGLPSEFVFIPLVESWYKPDAMGPGGPAGMWQMISSTARNHGIHIQPGYDGRLSPVESTRAALSYLKVLQDMFGDWQAIVMAYNAGEGRLRRAFGKAGSRQVSATNRKPHGLSNTTYDYVAKLQALACLISEPDKQGLQLPLSARFVPLAPVLMDEGVTSLDQFAAARHTDASEIRRLNPGYKGGRVIAGVPRLVLTPFGLPTPLEVPASVAVSSARIDLPPAPGDASLTHRVRSGDSLWSIAKQYSVSIDQLRSINQLGNGSVVQPGQTLKLVP